MISSFGKAQFDVECGSIAFEEALASLQENLDAGSASLSVTTEEGRATNKAMLETVESTNQYANAVAAMGGSTQDVQAILEAGRQRIIDTRIALGEGADQAKAYADRLIATPEAIATGVSLNGVERADQILTNLTRTRETFVNVITSGVQGAMDALAGINIPGKATGGTVGYAAGGTVGFAAGGTVPGIGGGISSGTVYGQGTSTSDSVLVRLSRGEEVIRASEAAKHRGLLKQINAGELSPGLTRGGLAPSAVAQTTVIERVYTETPTSLTVVDTNGALIGTMAVVADQKIGAYSADRARARRRTGP